MRDKKLKALTEILGTPYRSGDEYLFNCPYCEHHKRKMSINLDKNYYKCWACDTSGRNIYWLVRRFGEHQHKALWRDLTASIDFHVLEDLFEPKVHSEPALALPEGFLSLATRNIPPTGFRARNYLRKRGITKQDITWWKIGYCCEGEYAGRIIIPSFNSSGDLNYFVSRAYDDKVYPRYKNPSASRNIVFNDLFVDWSSNIILVEGVFDAIVAGKNAIPLLGSTLNERSTLLQRIAKEDAGVYVALDPDAKKKELEIIRTLLNFDIEVWKVNIGDYEDIGTMSKAQFQKCLDNAALITQEDYLLLTLAMSV